MFDYYLRLALRSFRHNPGITALMVLAIALGIAVCVMTLTVYHAMQGNPIWWKNDRLYAVTMDNWDPNHPLNPKSGLPPPEMTYKDTQFLIAANIPERKVVMYSTEGVVSGVGTAPAAQIGTRVTTADFFAMFEVPFLYGNGWSAAADRPAQPLIVLSRRENEKLFAGANSVGRTLRWNDHEFRVVGVLRDWFPRPRYYDLNGGSFSLPDDAYIPYGWGSELELLNKEENDCWRPEKLDTFRDYEASDCVWQQMWVELPDAASRARFQIFQLLLSGELLAHRVGYPLRNSRRVSQSKCLKLWADFLRQLHLYRIHRASPNRRNASASVMTSIPNRAAAVAKSRTLCVTIQSLPEAIAASRTISSSRSGTAGRIRKWITDRLPTLQR